MSSRYWEETDNPVFNSYPIQGIGSIYFENGDYRRAQEFFRKALILRQQSNDKLGLAGSLDSLGFTYFKLKQYKKAIDHCTKSLAISKATKDSRAQANAMIHLAEVYKATGNYTKAIALSAKSMEIRKKGGDKRGETELLLFQAGLYTKNNKQADRAMVPALLKEALSIANKIKALDLQSKIHYELYILYRLKKEFEKALEHLSIHSSLEKEHQQDKVDQKMQNLEITRKAEETRKEAAAVMDKNEELTRLNKELEIETSLERVRTVAMGMKKPEDMLDVCKTISLQLGALGVKEIRNVQTAIFYEKKGTYMNYEYYTRHKKAIVTETSYTNHKVHKDFAAKMIRGKGEFYTTHIKGKEVKAWIAYQKTTNVFIDTYLETTTSLSYYWHSLGPVALGISTYVPLSRNDTELFKRFLNVFELAYTRYLDIEKAYGQAREAQIEVAVERVRAKALAMHKSTEILGVVVAMQKELKGLNISGVTGATIYLSEEDGRIRTWDFTSLSEKEEEFQLRMDFVFRLEETDTKLWIRRIWSLKENYAVIKLDEKDFTRLLKFLRGFNMEAANNIQRLVRKYNIKHTWHPTVQLAQGKMNVDFIEPPPPEMEFILPRMGAAFDLAYKRFHDLQKAEAQAKEAKIEAALEKVRSQAMGMQKPGDILNVCKVMFNELPGIGFSDVRNAIIYFWDDASGTLMDYDYSDFSGGNMGRLTYSKNPNFIQFDHKIRSSKEAFAELILKGDQLKDWKKSRKERGEYEDPRLDNIDALYYYFYSIGVGAIGISSFCQISFENQEVLKRFRNVFDLAYRRYHDIEKAEAQAKEAQIQLALERVRARTMAMHKSEELAEIVGLMYTQFEELDFGLYQILVSIIDSKNNVIEWWSRGFKDTALPQRYLIPMIDHPFSNMQKKKWESGTDYYAHILEGDIKESWEEYLFNRTDLKNFPKDVQKQMRGLQKVYLSDAFMKHGVLQAAGPEPLPDDKAVILQRFAKVLDLAYTRMTDLQNAEAQAKEAQIELGLERVRARAMAMQNSHELKELIATVFNELTRLDFALTRCVIMIYDSQSNASTWWMANSEAPADPTGLFVKYHQHPPYTAYISAWKDRKNKWEYTLQGKVKKEWDKFLFGETELSHLPDPVIAGMSAPGRVYLSASFNNFGCLNLASLQPLSDEHFDILLRFAKVFDLTYTRFNDLKQAEAQAREAQVQLALERVRARTMAMQRSEELSETAALLFDQLQQLGEHPERAFIGIVNEKEQVVEVWATQHGGIKLDMLIKLPFEEPFVVKKAMKAWKEKRASVVIELKGDELEGYFQTLKKMGAPVKREIFGERRFENIAFYSNGMLGIITTDPRDKEAIELYERFAAVFDGTYTRFLDLQKAEGQAREAQIEAALEKVRSRSLAMHKSDELQEVVDTVFDKLMELQVEMDSCNIAIFKDEGRDFEYWIASPFQKRAAVFNIPYQDLSLTGDIIKARESGAEYSTQTYSFEEKNKWFEYAFQHTDFKYLEESRKKFILGAPGITVSIAFAKHTGLQINSYSFRSPSAGEADIIKRFSKVFEQAYIRFLDLQKAEAQAREARIEASLERVRARTMAMHKSDELPASASLLFHQIQDLGMPAWAAGYCIWEEDKQAITLWMSSEGVLQPPFKAPTTEDELFIQMRKGYEEGRSLHVVEMGGEQLVAHYQYMRTLPVVGDIFESVREAGHSLPVFQVMHYAYFSKGFLLIITYEPVPEAHDIFKRLAAVFDQTYTRFLDLQKAEAQAREATIEAALERVRYRAMAMQNSSDVGEATSTMFTELDTLGIETFRCGIAIVKEEELEVWSMGNTGDGRIIKGVGRVAINMHPLWGLFKQRWQNKEDFLYYYLAGQEKEDYVNVITHISTYSLTGTQLSFPDMHFQAYLFEDGGIFTFSLHPHSEADKAVMKKFTSVFSLTFRRYQDLQKAEAQAKEAKIEASLERVRSKAMAMHKTEDLHSAVAVVFEELDKLNLGVLRVGISVLNKEKRTGDVWVTSVDKDRSVQVSGDESFDIHPLLHGAFEAWLRQEDFYYLLEGDDLTHYYQAVEAAQFKLPESQMFSSGSEFKRQSCFVAVYNSGGLFAFRENDFSDEARIVMRRFAKVFDLTYKRFLDLQKAEAQTREAQIEASLERVRGKAMSMHSSKDLSDTVAIFFKELKVLGITPLRCGVGELDEAEQTSTLSATTAQQQGDSYEMIGKLKLAGHPVLENIFDHWKRQEEYFPVLTGKDLTHYYQVMRPQVNFPEYPANVVHYGNYFYFKEGLVFAWTEKELSEEELHIFRKFTSVISLTYRRYIELQKSEANALEAVKQASLDRIRADIASMRTIEDLERITPLIWNEFTVLGVSFIRCGVFIMDEEQQLIHTFLSTPDGKAIGAFHLPYTTPGNIQKVLSHWRNKRKYIDHWQADSFTAFADILMKQGTITSPEQYMSGIPENGFHLHFLPFIQGMLYVGNLDQLGEEEIDLIQSVANAFSTAYARYEDFNKLEAAKKQVDNTLSHLKEAQAQLVQSEKMASLGELTAGIAHEIQNPLNFVNNFSEVSNELLDEMVEEMRKGNFNEAQALVHDVKQNLEKINHHGKRADGIVKGMLQHSRSSSGQKELTDINALADEYLRLAYHGLRAKDKTFNAKFEIALDPLLHKITVVPQDIGRVILNLFTNAFYVVAQRKKKGETGYEPTVYVSTKNHSDKLEVTVKDNGSGIPAHALDKIFQPFFTTKPTGQGTGLGLSLSYDIVKAHGGEIKVNTKENEGTEFTIVLPAGT
ncbi:MAG TPA: tetratricopeptide repeat protein [Chitinophagaceae bacterium]|nr:tetratricopeptide repeat protein [Chitinophagaceae bacterium]